MEKILHEEQSFSADDGWVIVMKDDLKEIWRKKNLDHPIDLIKGLINFPDIPPNAVVDIIMDVKRRIEWDKQFSVIDILESEEHKVVYWMIRLPFGMNDRDLVQNMTHQYDDVTKRTVILYRNATHPDRPERRGIIRAETILSGVVIRPHPDDPKSTRMSILFQQDMKGWIPHSITTAASAKAPGNWQVNISDYYWNVYSKEHPQEDSVCDHDT